MNRRFVSALIVANCWATLALAQATQPAPIPGVDPTTPVGQMQQQFLMQFDINKDGRLDGQEQMMAQEAMRRQGMNMGIAPGGFPGADQFAKQFDRDRDGKLSPQEAAMAQAAFQRMRNGSGGGVRSGGGGGSSVPQQPIAPIAPPASAKPAKVSPLVKRFDKDGDGKLNADEKAAAQAEFKKGKEKDNDGKKDDAEKGKAEKDKAEKPAEKDKADK